MTPKHMPGPWFMDGRGYRKDTINGGEFIPVIGKDNSWIADVRMPKANARLIAAAPDLLQAVKDALEVISDMRAELDRWAQTSPIENRLQQLITQIEEI